MSNFGEGSDYEKTKFYHKRDIFVIPQKTYEEDLIQIFMCLFSNEQKVLYLFEISPYKISQLVYDVARNFTPSRVGPTIRLIK